MKKVNILFYLFAVCCILSIAIFSPDIVSSYLQKSIEGKVSYVDVGVKTYEVKYNSIWEKIVSIEKCIEEEGELKTVPIATEVTEQLKDTLTQEVIQQTHVLQEGILCDFFKIRKKHLVTCKKYAIYSSNNANGIELWYLTYQNKGNTLQLVMDAEFNHIYNFVLSLSKGGKELRQHNMTQIEKEGAATAIYSIYSSWIENFLNYFNIDRFRVAYLYPDSSQFYYNNLFLYGNLYYGKLENWGDANTSTNSSSYDDASKAKVSDSNYISIFCEYQFKEDGGISLNWGFSFFYSMLQL